MVLIPSTHQQRVLVPMYWLINRMVIVNCTYSRPSEHLEVSPKPPDVLRIVHPPVRSTNTAPGPLGQTAAEIPTS